MNRFTFLALGISLALCWTGIASAAGPADESGPGNSYYEAWTHYAAGKYYHCKYCFKIQQDDTDYAFYYCLWYPANPKYCYFFAPGSKAFFCRYDATQDKFSWLDDDQQQGDISKIPATAFKPLEAWPSIPGSKMSEVMAVPPIKKLPVKVDFAKPAAPPTAPAPGKAPAPAKPELPAG